MITSKMKHEFSERGYTLKYNFIGPDSMEILKNRFRPLFFEHDFSGNYPDDIGWRPYFGRPSASRFIVNVWKCDQVMADLVLNPALAKAAAELGGWSGARVANDTLWWKPPASDPLALHQDASQWLPFLVPPDMVTCWIALDDCVPGHGTLQLVPGSHKWPMVQNGTEMDPDSVSVPSYQRFAEQAAALAAATMKIDSIEGPAGLCVFHNGLVFHGSEANESSDDTRRAIAVHFIDAETTYGDGKPKFVFAKYKEKNNPKLSEQHFPITWHASGYRSESISDYTMRKVS